MKTRVSCVLLSLALLLVSGSGASSPARATPGTAENPVITLRYLEDEFLPSVRLRASLAAERRMSGVLADIYALLDGGGGVPLNEDALTRKLLSRLNQTGTNTAVRMAAGTTLTLGQGASVALLSGSAAHRGGVLIDSFAGQEAEAGGALRERRRYIGLSGESTVRVTADASVLIQGAYRVTLPYVPMYADLCEALMTMGVINTYELSRVTMRTEMFIIFVTILGVKDEASSAAGNHPFTDSPEWFDSYLAYLYDNNHTAGTGNNRFSPDDPGSVQQLAFILLKALGYQDGTDVTYATSVSDAVRLGVFTQREMDILQSEEFTRDAMMYMTYYSLFAHYKNGVRVLDHLTAIGQITAADAARATASVGRSRF
ncbi:MAG: hypothetical protein FWG72_02495 [Oscillospiraceae bacterium]|nr:hypothetical protein [Oscillospiraceae bacterium]